MDPSHPHAQLLADLQDARARLTARKGELAKSWGANVDPLLVDELREQVNDLADLCMALGQELWDRTRQEQGAQDKTA